MRTQPKILIADTHHAPWRDHCRATLAPLAANVIETGNPAVALHAARQDDVALILIDVTRFESQAYALADRLRQDALAAATPLIFVASNGGCERRQLVGYRAGAFDCLLNMPSDAELLRHKAEALLALTRERMALRHAVRRAERYCRALKAAQEAAWRRAMRDELTGLPNRTLFDDRLDQCLKQAHRARGRFALGFVDLDGFKPVNDRHGHAAGDELLVAVAGRLRGALRETDTVARLGGDEFGLLFKEVDANVHCVSLCDKLMQALAAPLTLHRTLDGRPVQVTPRASIGLALYPDHAREAVGLMRCADAAMYAAKRTGGNRCRCDAARLAEPELP